MKYKIPILFATLLLSQKGVDAQSIAQIQNMQSVPRVYAAPKAASTINIDGRDNDEAWQSARWTDDFIDIEGGSKAKPRLNTRAKMLWDDQYLYIYAKLDEPHVWGDLKDHDAIIYHNNDFEIFIKPSDQHDFYYEIEVNALNTIMDLMMPKPYRLGGDALMHWDVKGIKSSIHVEGTLNNGSDQDKYWSVEMAIPFKSLSTYARHATPKAGSYWKINFSRVQWQHEMTDNQYERKKKDNKHLPEDNWVWSPIGVVNMHHPERWGYIKFVESAQEKASLPAKQPAEQLAWNIFYLQQEHFRKHKQFAPDLASLQLYDTLLKSKMNNYRHAFLLNDAKSFYKLTINEPSTGLTITLDSHGNYRINNE